MILIAKPKSWLCAVLYFTFCSHALFSALPGGTWDTAATGKIDTVTEVVPGIYELKLSLLSRWIDQNPLSNGIVVRVYDTALYSKISLGQDYIFFIDTVENPQELQRLSYWLPRLSSVHPMRPDAATRSLLDQLGTPNSTLAVHDLQVYRLSDYYFWSPEFGLFMSSEFAQKRGFVFHEQIGWIHIHDEGPQRADWDMWMWHYESEDWMWTHLFIYPWIYSERNGWVFLLEAPSSFERWFYYANEQQWVRALTEE